MKKILSIVLLGFTGLSLAGSSGPSGNEYNQQSKSNGGSRPRPNFNTPGAQGDVVRNEYQRALDVLLTRVTQEGVEKRRQARRRAIAQQGQHQAASPEFRNAMNHVRRELIFSTQEVSPQTREEQGSVANLSESCRDALCQRPSSHDRSGGPGGSGLAA